MNLIDRILLLIVVSSSPFLFSYGTKKIPHHEAVVINSTTAKYRVTFHATWNPIDHPTDFPDFPHFSGLIGMTHNASTNLFAVNQLASEGIISMAETGSKFPLTTEISQLVSSGEANAILSGGGLGTGVGMVSLDFEIDQSHSLVSLTSMIAPSPDWFIGIRDIDLFEQGYWHNALTVPVGVYDSGSDSGLTFMSPDLPTIPREVISTIVTPPLAIDGIVASMGTMVFERIDGVDECSDRLLTFHDSPISSHTYTTTQSIIASGEILEDAEILFEAAIDIDLEAGFTLEEGALFEASIKDCQ